MKKLGISFIALLGLCLNLSAQSNTNSAGAVFIIFYILIAVLAAAVFLLLVFYRPKEVPRVEDNSKYLELKAGFDSQKTEIAALRTTEHNLRDQLGDVQSKLQIRDGENAFLQKQITEYETKETQADEARRTENVNLENCRKAFLEERQRVIAEDIERCKEQEANRDRLWNMHETESILKMKEICQKPNLLVPSYDNNNLPDDFDTQLKPDFMVRLLDQYMVFDPKLSKPENLQTYLASQSKKTAEKFRKSPSFERIYKSVFFIVPSLALQYLRQFSFYEQGFMFYVIPTESFEPVLTTLKRLEDYELADKYDPQERENIVNLIAAFEQHIRQQNATNILGTLRGIRVLGEKQLIPEEVADAIEAARKKIKVENPRPAELKKLIDNPDAQIEEVARMLKAPKPNLDASDFPSATGEET